MPPKVEALLKAMKKEIWKLTAKSIGLMYGLSLITAVLAVAFGLGQTIFPMLAAFGNVLYVELTYARPRRIEITERYKAQMLQILEEEALKKPLTKVD